MEAPDHRITSVRDLENFIEKFVPKLFYDWNFTYKQGLVVYVPKLYINTINRHLRNKLVMTSWKVLDIAERNT